MVNIVFGLDDKFVKFCAAAAASILTNHIISKPEDKIHFYFLGNISSKNKNKLLELRKIQDFEYSFPKIDISVFKGLPVGCWSQATYYRLLICDYVSGGKALYLDCDTIINGDICKLWNLNINECLAAAVTHNEGGKGGGYFNAGVMIFDIKKLREFNFNEKWREYVKHISPNSLKFPDQDILNEVLKDNVFYMSIEYNAMGQHYKYMFERNTADKILIYHYTPGKPLNFDCPPSLRNLYFKYSKLTYWKENMFHFWLRRFEVNPLFFLKPKYWRQIKEMRRQEKIGY
ncbi:MAG: glycosyltransferase family 8 protein [Endomicrobium sp.]|jgi:lipopolysaccharide biosynthesis glycosyltransferase|nr:glycosyltransferase family 8 protein [Endomicrobium sp.]